MAQTKNNHGPIGVRKENLYTGNHSIGVSDNRLYSKYPLEFKMSDGSVWSIQAGVVKDFVQNPANKCYRCKVEQDENGKETKRHFYLISNSFITSQGVKIS